MRSSAYSVESVTRRSTRILRKAKGAGCNACERWQDQDDTQSSFQIGLQTKMEASGGLLRFCGFNKSEVCNLVAGQAVATCLAFEVLAAHLEANTGSKCSYIVVDTDRLRACLSGIPIEQDYQAKTLTHRSPFLELDAGSRLTAAIATDHPRAQEVLSSSQDESLQTGPSRVQCKAPDPIVDEKTKPVRLSDRSVDITTP